jgi:hypothetical protein
MLAAKLHEFYALNAPVQDIEQAPTALRKKGSKA